MVWSGLGTELGAGGHVAESCPALSGPQTYALLDSFTAKSHLASLICVYWKHDLGVSRTPNPIHNSLTRFFASIYLSLLTDPNRNTNER